VKVGGATVRNDNDVEVLELSFEISPSLMMELCPSQGPTGKIRALHTVEEHQELDTLRNSSL
jgi:hypothetical protein